MGRNVTARSPSAKMEDVHVTIPNKIAPVFVSVKTVAILLHQKFRSPQKSQIPMKRLDKMMWMMYLRNTQVMVIWIFKRKSEIRKIQDKELCQGTHNKWMLTAIAKN